MPDEQLESGPFQSAAMKPPALPDAPDASPDESINVILISSDSER